MRPLSICLLCLLLTGLLSACGQRGPLYLPDGAHAASTGEGA